jgi:hypothetical protein
MSAGKPRARALRRWMRLSRRLPAAGYPRPARDAVTYEPMTAVISGDEAALARQEAASDHG